MNERLRHCGIEKLSLDEFCEAIHTGKDCWVFKEMKNPRFYRIWNDDEIWYKFNNGIDTIREFKDMPKYGEVWVRTFTGEGDDGAMLWGTWTQWTQY